MAPETIQAPHSADPRVDVYALASVGYLLMTGSTVFEAPSAVKMMVAQLEEMPVPPSLRVPEGVPAELEALVLRCLEKDPDKRPADGNELRIALLEARLEMPAWTESDARLWWESEGAEVMRAVEERSRESGEIGDIGEHATLRVSRVMGSGE
jgi:serine/threonine-protein kinase